MEVKINMRGQAIGFIVFFSISAFLFWYSGIEYLVRGGDGAGAIAFSLVAGCFGLVAPWVKK